MGEAKPHEELSLICLICSDLLHPPRRGRIQSDRPAAGNPSGDLRVPPVAGVRRAGNLGVRGVVGVGRLDVDRTRRETAEEGLSRANRRLLAVIRVSNQHIHRDK